LGQKQKPDHAMPDHRVKARQRRPLPRLAWFGRTAETAQRFLVPEVSAVFIWLVKLETGAEEAGLSLSFFGFLTSRFERC